MSLFGIRTSIAKCEQSKQKSIFSKSYTNNYFRIRISKRCRSVDEWISKQCVEETIETLLPCVGQKYFKSSRAKNVHLCVSHYNQTKRYNNFIPFHYIQFFGKRKRYKIVQSYLDIKLQLFTSLISKDTCKNLFIIRLRHRT